MIKGGLLMKYNYPVKYTAMPIFKEGCYKKGLESELDCYIVSKCYLLNDTTTYNENGTKEKVYKVIFPYQKGQDSIWERVTPSFRVSTSVHISSFVEEVFDNYEEAFQFASQKNRRLCKKTIGSLSYSESLTDQISKKIEEFNDKLARYKMLEQQILIHTSAIEQSKVKELNGLIISQKGNVRVLSNSLYEYLRCSSYSKFIVCSVTLEQYSNMEAFIHNQDMSDISKIFQNASPILYYDYASKENAIKVIDSTGKVLYDINQWEILKSNQSKSSVDLNVNDDETSLLFTTETLEDILLSFNECQFIDPDEIQGPVLKKLYF